jgi:hypothetical protein
MRENLCMDDGGDVALSLSDVLVEWLENGKHLPNNEPEN